jgi:hypothetical protein
VRLEHSLSTHYKLVSILLGACLAAAGCHSAPPTAEPGTHASEPAKLEAAELDRRVAEAAAKLSKVERNGVVFYCKRSRQMGTNIARLNCMTESQLRVEVETMAQVRDDMRNKMGKCTMGRAGHGGPCGGY